MCSIYGSFNRSMFDILHDATYERGKLAYSHVFINNKNKLIVHKQENHPDSMDLVMSQKNDVTFLGHNQAPTSAERKFNTSFAHPFQCSTWLCAHNGVITNFTKLNKKYTPWNKIPVDSSIIPSLLTHFHKEAPETPIVNVISKALNILEGTFAVYILDTDTPNIVYLARQGSTLFANKSTGSFASINSINKDWEELEEGKIYEMSNKKITEIGEFQNTTPFLTL